MDDQQILDRIHQLMLQEHALREAVEQGRAGDGHVQAAERITQLEVELDQAWDLLRQRRALREAGADPDGARERPAAEVEGYLD